MENFEENFEKIEELKEELLVALSELFTSDFFENLSKTQEGEASELLFLYRYEKPTIPSLISECLSISRARVTAITTSLNEKGLIRYERSLTDRRKLMLSITEKGIEEIKERLGDLDRRLINFLQTLGYEESQTFIRIINKITKIIEEEKKKGK